MTLIEQKAAASCQFSSNETGLFQVEGPYEHQSNVSKQTATFLIVARCQGVVGKLDSIM